MIPIVPTSSCIERAVGCTDGVNQQHWESRFTFDDSQFACHFSCGS